MLAVYFFDLQDRHERSSDAIASLKKSGQNNGFIIHLHVQQLGDRRETLYDGTQRSFLSLQ
jgi:ParB-like chromosome segregation protein Spo0J